jgi:hypothetical protein
MDDMRGRQEIHNMVFPDTKGVINYITQSKTRKSIQSTQAHQVM